MVVLPCQLSFGYCLQSIFDLFVSLNLKCISCKQLVVRPFFKICFVNICLLIEVQFSPVTFNVISDKAGFNARYFAICFLYVFYLFSPSSPPSLPSYVKYFLVYHFNFLLNFLLYYLCYFLSDALGIIINILTYNNLVQFFTNLISIVNKNVVSIQHYSFPFFVL